VGDAPASLPPDPRPGGADVRERAGRVVVLVGEPPAGRLVRQPGRDVEQVTGVLTAAGGGRRKALAASPLPFGV
jgi:hypothetical protein